MVSIAAGLTCGTLRGWLAGAQGRPALLRVMPNTPAAIGKGMLALCAEAGTAEEYLAGVEDLLAPAGRVERIAEGQMDAFSAVAGCGPAFVYPLHRGPGRRRRKGGPAPGQAVTYAAQMVLGAAAMVLESGKHPGQLKDEVCSPGGSTIAGVAALEEQGLPAPPPSRRWRPPSAATKSWARCKAWGSRTGALCPSPSGRMHLGNVFSALLAWLSVRRAGGVMVLRMEDLDPDRCRAAYAEQLADDLRWLGLDWDEGYQKGGAHGPYLQSERTARYAAAFRALEERGLVYPRYCTRAERLAASAPTAPTDRVVYSGKCRHLTEEERARLAQTRCPAWRLIVPDQEISFTDGLQGTYRENLLRDCGDFILRRSDGVYAYQLAVVCDDGDMGITQVVRGRDLLDSTPGSSISMGCWA